MGFRTSVLMHCASVTAAWREECHDLQARFLPLQKHTRRSIARTLALRVTPMTPSTISDEKTAAKIESKVRLQNDDTKTLAGADKLADDRADDRKHDGGVQAGKDVGHGMGKLQIPQALAARGAKPAQQIQPVGVGRAQSGDGVDQHWKHRRQGDDEELRFDPKSEPYDHERSDRDLWNALERDDIGIEDPVHERRERQRGAETDAQGRAGRKAQKNFSESDRHRPPVIRTAQIVPKRVQDF